MKLRELIVGNEENLSRKNFLWNMIGSTMYAFASVILFAAATRTVGEDEAGIFVLAFTTGQLMLTIGFYEMRPFQVTDVSNKYEFKDYYTTRIITSILMMLGSFLYVSFFMEKFTWNKAIIVILMCLYKMFDGLADVFEGGFQKVGRLDVAGKSLTFRTLITSILFIATLILTKSVIIASVVTVIGAAITFFIFDISIINSFEKIEMSFNFKKVKEIFRECFPFFLASFMSMYIFSCVRYAIDANMNESFQTYFNAIFLPTSTISLLSSFILKPLLTTLATSWQRRNSKEFKGIIVKLLICIVGFTVIAVGGAYIIGIPVLSFIFHVELSPYKFELLILLVGGGISAASTTFYYCLTVMRKPRSIFMGYFFTFIIALIFPGYFVRSWGLTGASIFYCGLMVIMTTSFAILVFNNFNKHKNDKL